LRRSPEPLAPAGRRPAAIVRRRIASAPAPAAVPRAPAFAKWASLGLEIGKKGGEANANDARDACRDLC